MELYFIFHIMHFMCASSLICTTVERTCLSQGLSPFRREAIGSRDARTALADETCQTRQTAPPRAQYKLAETANFLK